MTNYQRGNAFERRVKEALERDGYWVWQTRGSKSAADLIALKLRETVLVQVKGADTVPGVEVMSGDGWNALWQLAVRVGAFPVVANRDGRRIRYRLLTGPHRHASHDWPCEAWTPDRLV